MHAGRRRAPGGGRECSGWISRSIDSKSGDADAEMKIARDDRKYPATRSPRPRSGRKKAMPSGMAVERVAAVVDQVGEERDRARQQ